MSQKRDWLRARRQNHHRLLREHETLYSGPVRIDPLEPLIQAAVHAKRENRFLELPRELSAAERKRIWRAAFHRLASERATTGGPTS